MSTFKNIVIMLFCWTLGNSVYARTSDLFSQKDQQFIDPSLAKITAHFEFKTDDDVTSNSGSPCGASDSCSHVSLSFFPSQVYNFSLFDGNHIKKSYLFITSGTSPPQSV
ncbi:MAG: hypothetical protein AB8G05_10140 [Oligoflexales bacterium]